MDTPLSACELILSHCGCQTEAFCRVTISILSTYSQQLRWNCFYRTQNTIILKNNWLRRCKILKVKTTLIKIKGKQCGDIMWELNWLDITRPLWDTRTQYQVKTSNILQLGAAKFQKLLESWTKLTKHANLDLLMPKKQIRICTADAPWMTQIKISYSEKIKNV